MSAALPVAGMMLAIFVAAALQAASGFGFALIAMPLVTLALGIDLALPVVAAVAVALTMANSVRLRRHIDLRELGGLVAAALAGVPVGFWLVARVPAASVRLPLGLVLIAYVLYVLLRPQGVPRPGPWWVIPAGFAAGALGGAYNVPGPPVVVYGDLRAWPRNCYRATLQAFFFLTGLVVVVTHALLGHFQRETGLLLMAAVPALVLGNGAGVLADRFIDQRRFRQIVLGLILATGVLLLF